VITTGLTAHCPQLRLVTEFGTMADPIADKALIGAALIGLSILAICRGGDGGDHGARDRRHRLRFGVLPTGHPASRGGKLKTLVQAVAIACSCCPFGANG